MLPTNKPIITATHLFLSLILFLCVSVAMADPSAGIGSFLSQVGEEDFSANIIRKTFGNGFVDSIGAVGGVESGNVLGEMFAIFNTALLAVAMFYFGYQSVAAAAATAEDGQFMGQRFSTVWVPIRFTIGVVSLVPMFGGFGGAQVIFMWFTKIGIGMANAMVIAGLAALSLDPELMASKSSPVQQRSEAVAKALFEGHRCVNDAAKNLAGTRDNLPAETRAALANNEVRQIVLQPGGSDPSYRIVFTTVDAAAQNQYMCGGARLAIPDVMSSLGDETLANYSDKVSSLGSTYQSTVIRVAQTELLELNREMSELAQLSVQNEDSVSYRVDIQPRIKEAAERFDVRLNEQIKAEIPEGEASNQALVQANEFINKYGWLMLGSFYQTVATAQSVFDQSTKVTLTPIPYGGGSPVFADQTEKAGQNTASGQEGGAELSIGDITQDLGQSLVLWTARFTMTDSGTGTFNPIMELKDLGDTIVWGGVGILGAYVFSATIIEGAKAVGGVLSKIPGVGSVFGGVANVASSSAGAALGTLAPFIILLIVALFFFGFMLSVYIPMLPFITWYGGIIGWFSSVIESLVAAPVGAFIHLDVEGQGMGQRTQHTYLFLMNVLLRPALMVFGFFAASLGVMVLGKVLFLLFIPAMATAQTDSFTGLIMAVGYIFVFMSLALTMIHGAFNLIHIIPDSVISWAGGHISTKMGQDTDNNTLGAFTKGSSRSDSAASQTLAAGGKRESQMPGSSRPASPPGA